MSAMRRRKQGSGRRTGMASPSLHGSSSWNSSANGSPARRVPRGPRTTMETTHSVYAQARQQLEQAAAVDAARSARKARRKRKAARHAAKKLGKFADGDSTGSGPLRDLGRSLPGPLRDRAGATDFAAMYGAHSHSDGDLAAYAGQQQHVRQPQQHGAHGRLYDPSQGTAEEATRAASDIAGRVPSGHGGATSFNRHDNIFVSPAAARGASVASSSSKQRLGRGSHRGKRRGKPRVSLQSTWADPASVAHTMVSRITQHVLARKPAAPVKAPAEDATFLTQVAENNRFGALTVGAPESLEPGDDVPRSLIPVRFYQEDVSPIYSALQGEGDAEFDPVTGNWTRPVFPTNRPSNRNEVFHLRAALDTMLREVYALPASAGVKADDLPLPKPAGREKFTKQPRTLADIDAKPLRKATEGLAALLHNSKNPYGFHPAVAAEVSVWGLVLFELVRQSFVHCEERGVLLEQCRVRLMEIITAADGWCQRLAEARIRAEKFAEKKMQEAAVLRRRADNVALASGQGSQALREQIESLAKQLEQVRAAQRAAASKQTAMESFMRKQHMLNDYHRYAEDNVEEAELFDCGCGEDLDGNFFAYHDSANIEVQTEPVDFLDDEEVQRALEAEKQDAIADAQADTVAKYKLLLQQAKRDAVCNKECRVCGTKCGEEAAPADTAADESKDEPEVPTLPSLPAGKKQFVPPAGWLKFLGLSAKTKRVKGKVMPLRSFHMLMLQVYHEKIQADENAMSESTPCQSMADYVVNFMLFKFGTRKLVQKRVSSLVATLQKTYKKDPAAALFARFCGMSRPLPTQCLTAMLETLELGFRGGFSSVLLSQGKDPDKVTTTGLYAIAAARVLAGRLAFSNVALAEHRIFDLCESTAKASEMKARLKARQSRALMKAKQMIHSVNSANSILSKTGRSMGTRAATTMSMTGLKGVESALTQLPSSRDVGGRESPTRLSSTASQGGLALSSVVDQAANAAMEFHVQSCSNIGIREASIVAANGGDLHAALMVAATATAKAYFVRGDHHVDAQYSSMRVASASLAGMKEGHLLAKQLGVTVPTQEVVTRAARTAARLVSLRSGKHEVRAALRIQALVRGTQARSSARKQKAAKLRFAKLGVFDFIQALVDVWESARLTCEERLVSMFMLGDKNDDGVLDYPEFEPLAREFAELVGSDSLPAASIRHLFSVMVTQEDSAAISMHNFISNMASFANDVRRRQAGEIRKDKLLTNKMALGGVSMRRKASARVGRTGGAMAAVAEVTGKLEEGAGGDPDGNDDDDDDVGDEPVVAVNEDTVLDALPPPVPPQPKRTDSAPSTARSRPPSSRIRSAHTPAPKTAVAPTAMAFPMRKG